MFRKLLIVLLIVSARHSFAQDSKMNSFIDVLMKKMTLDEKIGQLNLPSVGFDVTGPLLSKDVDAKIRKGLVGAVFNTYTPIAVRKLQDIAVKETRLKIPLMFGYDVIHGHRTIFPIPLGLSASWDIPLIEKTARAAAEAATGAAPEARAAATPAPPTNRWKRSPTTTGTRWPSPPPMSPPAQTRPTASRAPPATTTASPSRRPCSRC